jgi:hypothetical protein
MVPRRPRARRCGGGGRPLPPRVQPPRRGAREGTYSLFVTVTSLSQATQYAVCLNLDVLHIIGAHKAGAGEDLVRRVNTLGPGVSETEKFPLGAEATGRVVASIFQSGSPALTGAIHLRTGCCSAQGTV